MDRYKIFVFMIVVEILLSSMASFAYVINDAIMCKAEHSMTDNNFCLIPTSVNVGRWCDYRLDARGLGYSGPEYPEPNENHYVLQNDTLTLFTYYFDIPDVYGEPIRVADFFIERLGIDTVRLRLLYSSKNLSTSSSAVWTISNGACQILSRQEYEQGWDVVSDTTFIINKDLVSIKITSASMEKQLINLINEIDSCSGNASFPLELLIGEQSWILNEYLNVSEMQANYDAVCLLNNRALYIKFQSRPNCYKMTGEMQTLPVCVRRITYSNGVQKDEDSDAWLLSTPIYQRYVIPLSSAERTIK